jgi:5,10-methylenetetrahydromethanopterin reductase
MAVNSEGRVALYLQDKHPLRDAIGYARYAEERGFEAVWQAESRLVREATVPMAAYAATTDRIGIGSGIKLGIGAWWDPLAQKVGIERRRPFAVMREVVEATRRLIAMEHVTYEGEYVHLDGVEIDVVHGDRSPRDVPIYLGATGMKMMELAGEIGDGVLLNYLVGPRYNEAAMEHLAVGAARAGRRVEDIDRPQLVVCSLDDDRAVALDRARELVTQYLGQQPHIGKASGVDEGLLASIREVLTWPAGPEEIRAAMELVPDEVVQMVAAAGTADECRAKVREFVDAGCTCPVLYPLGDDVRAMIDAFAEGSF